MSIFICGIDTIVTVRRKAASGSGDRIELPDPREPLRADDVVILMGTRENLNTLK